MSLSISTEGNSLLEQDLHDYALHNKVDSIYVVETPDGFYVIAKIRSMTRTGSPKELYLCTRRERTSPKFFSRLERLNERLKEICPGIGFKLIRTSNTVNGTPARDDI